jgi:hypothetical protein
MTVSHPSAPVAIPDSRLARDATELIRSVESDLLYHHSLRVANAARSPTASPTSPRPRSERSTSTCYERPNFCAIIRSSPYSS